MLGIKTLKDKSVSDYMKGGRCVRMAIGGGVGIHEPRIIFNFHNVEIPGLFMNSKFFSRFDDGDCRLY